MRYIYGLLIGFLMFSVFARAADQPNLSKGSLQELLSLYKQLRSIQSGGGTAITENVLFRRDSATFTFITGHMMFAAPVAGRVLAAQFQGEGTFALNPPLAMDQRQIARFAGSPKLIDTFREAVFYFTDDTYAEMNKLMKIVPAPASNPNPFASFQKKYAENLNGWIKNQRKGNPTMRNMAARMLADLTDSSSKGFFLADFKCKRSGDLLFHISWNRDSLLLPDESKGEEVMLLHLNLGNYYEWWSGFHLLSEYAQSPHPDHRTLLAHCPTTKIDLEIKNNEISATVHMEYVVSENSVRVLPFNLNGVLRISSVENDAGNKLGFIQEERNLDNDPWLILAEPAKPGEKHRIKIAYKEDSTGDSRLIIQRGSGLYYVTARESWFPSFGAFDDRTQFEINARSPKKYKFVASGSQVKSQKEKDDLVTSWKSDIPLTVVGFNYGDFVEASQASQDLNVTAYSGKEVPDELKSRERAISVAQLKQLNSGVIGDVESRTGSMLGGFNTASSVKYASGVSFQALKFFEYLYGALPFKSISITEQPVSGYGQSWPYLIFLPYDSLLDATTRNSLGLQSGSAIEFYQLVPVHEMAHQWWGHVVGWKTYHDQWLSEGTADFSAMMYLRQFAPKEVDSFWDIRKTRLLSKNALGYRPVDAGPVWMNSQLNEYNAGDNSRLIYDKGAYIMEMLRAIMYDTKLKNPDARFINMMHDFVKTFSGQNASTEDFRRIVEKHVGTSMEWFFNEWVYGREIPNYDFSYQLADAAGGQTDLSISLVQSNVSEVFHMEMPLYLTIKGELRYLGTLGVTGTKPIKISVKLPVRPERVVLDPNRSILAEIHQ